MTTVVFLKTAAPPMAMDGIAVPMAILPIGTDGATIRWLLYSEPIIALF